MLMFISVAILGFPETFIVMGLGPGLQFQGGVPLVKQVLTLMGEKLVLPTELHATIASMDTSGSCINL